MPGKMRKVVARRAQVSLKPPQYNSHPTITRAFRFLATAGISNAFCGAFTLQQVIGMMATSTTNVCPIAPVLRINRVRIWGTTAGAGSSSTVAIQWTSSSQSFESGSTFEDTSTNPSVPPFVDSRPPKKSLAGDWICPGNTFNPGLFGITCASGSVIEVSLSYKQGDGASVGGLSGNITVAGATVGTIYYFGCDGRSNNQTVPLGLVTI